MEAQLHFRIGMKLFILRHICNFKHAIFLISQCMRDVASLSGMHGRARR